MDGHRRSTGINFSFPLRAIRLAGGLGLYLFPDQRDREDLQVSEESLGIEVSDPGRNREQSPNVLRNLDGDASSDSGNDDSREEKENEYNACIEEEYCDENMKSRRSRYKKDLNAPLEHAISHMTKMRVSSSEDILRFSHTNKKEMVSIPAMLSGRELNVSGHGNWSRSECCHVAARFLPVNGPTEVARMRSKAYIGQFSVDGSLFVAGFQDRRIRIYNVDEGWKIQKDITARNLRWTVTDTALSYDQRFLIYASISPVVHLVNVGRESGGVESLANVTDIHEGLDFSMETSEEYSFGLYSIQFSHDGREVVAGSSDRSIYVYDLGANKPVLRLEAHEDDVNAVTFADESCHIIYSGSDDAKCKVWDRRCLASNGHPAGVLTGHLEGVTFIDSRGDDRYFISNGKDQALKLWDIRNITSTTPVRKAYKIPRFTWDYRWMEYPGSGENVHHPYDQSLMTYKGHSVLRTLIRCYFSPAFTTGQKYIYTGSHDGCVYIYDLITGKLSARLGNFHRLTVRDCSWHPLYPVLVSSSWDGIIAKWEHTPEYSLRMEPSDFGIFDSD